MNEQPTINITLERIADFIQEATDHGVKRVYRKINNQGAGLEYTAWDPERKTLLTGHIGLASIEELNALVSAERYRRGFQFDEEPNTIIAHPQSKYHLVQLLRGMKVAKDVVSEFRTVKVEQINKMIDDSIAEETGDKIFTVHESCGFIEKTLECDVLEGQVKQARVRMLRDHHNGISYSVSIDNWNKVFQALLAKHEAAFEKAKLVVVPGHVTMSGR